MDNFTREFVEGEIEFLELLAKQPPQVTRKFIDTHLPYLKRAATREKQKNCNHKYPDGSLATIVNNGFMFSTFTCKLCGKMETDL